MRNDARLQISDCRFQIAPRSHVLNPGPRPLPPPPSRRGLRRRALGRAEAFLGRHQAVAVGVAGPGRGVRLQLDDAGELVRAPGVAADSHRVAHGRIERQLYPLEVGVRVERLADATRWAGAETSAIVEAAVAELVAITREKRPIIAAFLVNALEELKKEGFWIVGADPRGDQNLYGMKFDMNVGLVIGSEGKGIRPLVLKKCDYRITIPMKGRVSSLNAGIAGAVILFEIQRQQLFLKESKRA